MSDLEYRERVEYDHAGGAAHRDRARRLYANHQPSHHRGPGRRSCGLCLRPWPCPDRRWAENTLRPAAPPRGATR
jgi:hypothetical protein